MEKRRRTGINGVGAGHYGISIVGAIGATVVPVVGRVHRRASVAVSKSSFISVAVHAVQKQHRGILRTTEVNLQAVR
jgi:hypothetical protein